MDLEPLTYGSAVGNRLTGVGRVTGVYGKAVNIAFSTGFCLSLVNEIVDGGPNRIRLKEADYVKLPLKPGDMVRVTPEALYHARVTVSLPEGKRVVKSPGPVRVGQESLVVLKEVLASGRGSCLIYLGRKATGSWLDSAVAGQVRIFAQTRKWQDAKGLIGLGTGLTPSGDDILVGYTAVASRTGELPLTGLKKLLEHALLLTIELSYTALYFAAEGLVQDYLDDVLTALDGPPQVLAAAAQRLIANVGSTSGSDILLGVFIGCRAILKNKGMSKDAKSIG